MNRRGPESPGEHHADRQDRHPTLPRSRGEYDAEPAERLYAAYCRSGHHGSLGRDALGGIAPTWAELKARALGNDPSADREILRWQETARWALDFLSPFVRESAPEQPAQPYIN